MTEEERVQKCIWLRNNREPEAKLLLYMKELFVFRRSDMEGQDLRRVKMNWPRLFDSSVTVSQKYFNVLFYLLIYSLLFITHILRKFVINLNFSW